jgi:hypothetical protein
MKRSAVVISSGDDAADNRQLETFALLSKVMFEHLVESI